MTVTIMTPVIWKTGEPTAMKGEKKKIRGQVLYTSAKTQVYGAWYLDLEEYTEKHPYQLVEMERNRSMRGVVVAGAGVWKGIRSFPRGPPVGED